MLIRYKNTLLIEQLKDFDVVEEIYKQWRRMGFTDEEADRWMAIVPNPSEAYQWKEAGFEPDDIVKIKKARKISDDELKVWRELGFTVDEILDWQCLGPEEAKAWRDEGFDAKTACEWIETMRSLPLTDEGKKRVTEAEYRLIKKNLTPKLAKEWSKYIGQRIKVGDRSSLITIYTALLWTGLGLTVQQAMDWMKAGIPRVMAKEFLENKVELNDAVKWIEFFNKRLKIGGFTMSDMFKLIRRKVTIEELDKMIDDKGQVKPEFVNKFVAILHREPHTIPAELLPEPDINLELCRKILEWLDEFYSRIKDMKEVLVRLKPMLQNVMEKYKFVLEKVIAEIKDLLRLISVQEEKAEDLFRQVYDLIKSIPDRLKEIYKLLNDYEAQYKAVYMPLSFLVQEIVAFFESLKWHQEVKIIVPVVPRKEVADISNRSLQLMLRDIKRYVNEFDDIILKRIDYIINSVYNILKDVTSCDDKVLLSKLKSVIYSFGDAISIFRDVAISG